jgi:hypothetical protein
MHEMHTMYEAVRVPVPREVTMLKAAVLPMFMREMMMARAVMTRIAFTGASTFGWIYLTVWSVFLPVQVEPVLRRRIRSTGSHILPSIPNEKMACLHRVQKQTVVVRTRP